MLPEPPAALVEIDDGDTRWRFDAEFLRSNWTCIWGRGCQGIEHEPAEHLARGCCSVGAELTDLDEAKMVSALADTVGPELFEHHAAARDGGVFSDERRVNTRIVDGACIFLNRPGFSGGAGCALHLAALSFDEPPSEWKPSVCWQVPIRVDWEMGADDIETATVRRWARADWGADGEAMAWWCTEGTDAFVGDRPVVESMGDELALIVGTPVYLRLRAALGG